MNERRISDRRIQYASALSAGQLDPFVNHASNRRHEQRRISPAIGEFAIQQAPALGAEIDRLRASNEALALRVTELAVLNDKNIARANRLHVALENLQKQLREHVKFDVKKHYSLMVADIAASKALDKVQP